MIKIKSPEEIKLMRQSGKILAEILKKLVRFVRAGMSTKLVEKEAERMMQEKKVISAFKGYYGYPASLCISLNEELIHGIPREDKIIKGGDLISIDFGVKYEGYCSDMAYTFAIGKIDKTQRHLLAVGKEALRRAIKRVREGAFLGDVGFSIQEFVKKEGFFVVKDFVGHGIGKDLHEEPEVPNFGREGEGVCLRRGMTLAIEPMITQETEEVKIKEDGWTVVSASGKPCVHFEHTVAVTKRGCLVLTN